MQLDHGHVGACRWRGRRVEQCPDREVPTQVRRARDGHHGCAHRSPDRSRGASRGGLHRSGPRSELGGEDEGESRGRHGLRSTQLPSPLAPSGRKYSETWIIPVGTRAPRASEEAEGTQGRLKSTTQLQRR